MTRLLLMVLCCGYREQNGQTSCRWRPPLIRWREGASRIRTIRPLRDGVIADFNAAEQMIRGMVKMVSSKRRWFSPSLRMVVCIPPGSTEVEIRAVRDSSEHAGGRDVYMIYEPMAAALGIGLDVEAARRQHDSRYRRRKH